jgi:hypothetical protein
VIADSAAHFKTALASLSILLDVEFKAYMKHKAGEFFQAYGFVPLDGKEDIEGAQLLLQQPRHWQPRQQQQQPRLQLQLPAQYRAGQRRPAHLVTVLIEA